MCEGTLHGAEEECPPYLGESIEGKKACNLASHEYLSGKWKKRAGRCQVDEEEALKELAYPFTWICHENEWGESCAADAKVSTASNRKDLLRPPARGCQCTRSPTHEVWEKQNFGVSFGTVTEGTAVCKMPESSHSSTLSATPKFF